MRTVLLAAAITAALVLPLALDRPPPAPLATAPDVQPQDLELLDPVVDMAANGCKPTMQAIDGDLTFIQLCP